MRARLSGAHRVRLRSREAEWGLQEQSEECFVVLDNSVLRHRILGGAMVTELGLPGSCRGFATLLRVQGEQHILAAASSKQAHETLFGDNVAQNRHQRS